MKKVFAFLFIICAINSCSESSSDDSSQGNQIYEAPRVRSYVTYTSQNSVTLNGFIDHESVYFLESDSFNVGFIFRTGDENDSSNDQLIELDQAVDYYTGTYNFNHTIVGLEPNTTYYYTARTKNGSSISNDWESFTTSSIPCTQSQNNQYSISGGMSQSAYVEITDPQCCSEGNVGFRFGNWPNIFQVNFNELDNGYPQTGEYFGVGFEFDITHLERELTKSTNQVLFEYMSTEEARVFVENDGETITLIFCNTILRNDVTLDGKVSVAIP